MSMLPNGADIAAEALLQGIVGAMFDDIKR